MKKSLNIRINSEEQYQFAEELLIELINTDPECNSPESKYIEYLNSVLYTYKNPKVPLYEENMILLCSNTI